LSGTGPGAVLVALDVIRQARRARRDRASPSEEANMDLGIRNLWPARERLPSAVASELIWPPWAEVNPESASVLRTHLRGFVSSGKARRFNRLRAHRTSPHLLRTGWPWRLRTFIRTAGARLSFAGALVGSGRSDRGSESELTTGPGTCFYLGPTSSFLFNSLPIEDFRTVRLRETNTKTNCLGCAELTCGWPAVRALLPRRAQSP
jgi:hypothetical protein